MITYLTQLTICWTILFAVYYIFLKRETFFAYNRWFLLAGLVLGLAIPLIDWTVLIIHEAEGFGHMYVAPVQTQVHQIDVYVDSSEQTPWWYLLLMTIYLTGLLVTSIKLLYAIREILSLRKGAEITQQKGYELVLTRQHHMPFSFMNSVYWSGELYRESEEKDRILAHEARHVSALHSLDILFIELLSILFWFHPMVYMYRKEIKEVHEFEADAAACILGSRKAYGQLLLNQANSGLQLALANHFFYSQLKNRFKMMTRKPSAKTAKLKYLIAIPIIGLAVLVFSFVNKDIVNVDQSVFMSDTLIPPPPPPISNFTDITIVDKELKEDIRKNGEIFRVVEQMPRFPGCEDQTGSNQDIKLCADKKMLEFLYKNIKYPAKARSNGVEGNVVISFIVEKDGSLTHPRVIRDPGAGLGEEAVRTVNMMADLPEKWTPGVQRDHKVRVQFILPVKFELKPEQKKEFTYYSGINIAKLPNELPTNNPDGTRRGNKTVVGKVVDMNGQPIIGANVMIKGSQTGTATDFNGEYRLSGIDKNDELVFLSNKGYVNRELPVNSHYFLSSIVQLPTVKLFPTPLAVEEVYKGDLVDALPRFPGCEKVDGSENNKTQCAEKKFLMYLYENIRYPALARNNLVQGQVIASFVVKKDGTIGYVQILRDLGAGLGEEVEQLLKSMNKQGKWTPAMKDGQPINFQMTLPVTFKLKGDNVESNIKKVNLDKVVNLLSEIVVVALADPSVKPPKELDMNDEIQKAIQEGTMDAPPEITVVGHDSDSSNKDKVKGIKKENNKTRSDGSDNSLSEVVVMGYGTKIKSVNAEEQPALIILDGYIIGRTDRIKSLNYVDSENIESISVLKGQKAVEKYGDQGKNGVIEITTKKPVLKPTNAKLILSNFNLYPNPASNELMVNFQGPAGDYRLEVVDVKGATQMSKEINHMDHVKTIMNISMNISDLNSGVYYLLIKSNSKVTAKVFVKE